LTPILPPEYGGGLRIKLHIFGSIKSDSYQELSDYYVRLLSKYFPAELIVHKDVDEQLNPDKVSPITKQGFSIILSERGHQTSTEEFARIIDEQKLSQKALHFICGNAHGFTPEAERLANFRMCLSPWTLAHELALVVLCEQLYRVCNLNAGGKYHK
jgi:23S rRNA (pseudouridine1915-N3)-methyltransferase